MNGKFLGGLVLTAALVGWSSVGAQSPKLGESEDVTLIPTIQGPALYKAYCASCHGVDAKGNGPMAEFLKVRPSDLTRISARNAGTFPLMQVERIIQGEGQLQKGHGPREMPVWGPIFSRVEDDRDLGLVRIDNLARYLRDIQTK
jgi:mono/diheme cytochrome c family protein